MIGCGSVAGAIDDPLSPNILSHGKALSLHPNFELAGCYDLDPTAASLFQKKWGCRQVYSSIEEMLKEHFDLFVVATTTSSHFSILEKLLRTSCTGIICEKPLVTSLGELKQLQEALLQSPKKIVVNFTRRFDEAHQKLRSLIANSQLGPLLHFHGNVGKGLIHNGCHLIDLLSYLFGGIKKIQSISVTTEHEDHYGKFLVTLPSEIQGILQTTKDVSYSLFELDLLFQNGRISIKDIGYEIVIERPSPSTIYPGYNRLAQSQRFEPTFHRAFYNLYEMYATDRIPVKEFFTDALSVTQLIFSVTGEAGHQ